MKHRSKQRWAILLSAAVCPGAGQWIQGRRFAAALLGFPFLALFTWLLIETLVPLFRNVQAALAMAAGEPGPELRALALGRILTLFGLALLDYLVNLADILYTARRSRPGRPGRAIRGL